jgi:DNA-binding NtrC family response regulator
VVDADAAARRVLVSALERSGRRAVGAGSGGEARRLAAERAPALAVLEMVLPDGDGLRLLDELRALWPGLPAVIVTRYPEPRSIVEAMRRGALDYLAKPIEPETLLPLCRLVETRALSATGADPVELAGASPAMAGIRATVARLAQARPTSLLIVGENGVGKTTIARAVHSASGRARGPLLPYGCAGAHAPAIALLGRGGSGGLLDAATGGTVVLDDVDQLDPATQEAVRASVEADGDGRLLLVGLACPGEPRSPLLTWLGRVCIEVPPLHTRPDDVLPLARAIAARASGGRADALSPAAEARLAQETWPGNAAELAATVERAATLADGGPIQVEHLEAGQRRAPAAAWAPSGPPRPLRDVTEAYIAHVLSLSRGNRSRAARLLGVSRETLRLRLSRSR